MSFVSPNEIYQQGMALCTEGDAIVTRMKNTPGTATEMEIDRAILLYTQGCQKLIFGIKMDMNHTSPTSTAPRVGCT